MAAIERENGKVLAKLRESPFYPEGGGQVADAGTVETDSGVARVSDVFRIGDDQAVELSVENGDLNEGDQVRLTVDWEARHATASNHTATHLLHAALRQELGTHVRQAGSAVRPDKLRFDFTHGRALSRDELDAIEDQVNRWIAESHPVRAINTTRKQAEALGAMALFGEKYGDEVRMIEVEAVSRELCGGTHVQNTAEVGIFKLVGEGSSAANVRRIEAVTGPEAARLMRERDAALARIADRLRTRPEDAPAAVESALERAQAMERELASGGAGQVDELARELTGQATEVDGLRVVTAVVELGDPKALLDLSDRVKSSLQDGAVVLGTVREGRPHLIASLTKSAVGKGLNAADIIRAAAETVGGRGGGRDTMAQAGGKDAEKLEEALAVARRVIEEALT